MLVHLSNAFLRSAAEKLYGRRPEEERLHVFGIRSASPEGENTVLVHEPQANRYDDTLGVFGTAFRIWPGTVDPGATWTKHPSNSQGAAHLVPGSYLYRLGTHKGKPALVQGGPVTVRRDKDRDGTAEGSEPLDSGYFGINIHRMGNGPAVDDWSAGCQGTSAERYQQLYTLCATSGQSEFRYWLFDGKALGKLVTS